MNSIVLTGPDYRFLVALAEELRTQDSIASAIPLYCVFEKEKVPLHDDIDGDGAEWFCHEQCEVVTPESMAEYCEVSLNDIADIDAQMSEWGCTHYKYVLQDRFVSAHLTMKAADGYLEANARHLKSGFVLATNHRCEEFNRAIKILSQILERAEPCTHENMKLFRDKQGHKIGRRCLDCGASVGQVS